MVALLENDDLSEFMGRSSRKRGEECFSCGAIGNDLYYVFEKTLLGGSYLTAVSTGTLSIL